MAGKTNFKLGDRVRVNYQASIFHGHTGTVVKIDWNNDVHEVLLNGTEFPELFFGYKLDLLGSDENAKDLFNWLSA